MSFFARASWPGDHRDEVVAGALAAAVIVVLGYASGIGAPAPQSVDTAAPPATTAPADPPAANTPGSAEPPATSADAGAGSGVLPVGDAPPVTGGTGVGGHGGHHGKGGAGDSTGPSRTPPESPSPSPSPAPSESCDDGQVRLVQPLLSGANDAVTGLLDGLPVTASPSPSLSASPSTSSMPAMSDEALCLGVTPSISLLPGLTP
jgi:hypothetical protein